MKKIAVLLFFVAFATATVTAQESWGTATFETFSIKHPTTWRADTSNKNVGVDVILYAPQTSEGDNFNENINVIAQDLTGYDMTLDSYTQLSEEQIKNMLENGKVLESVRVNNDSETYHRIVYVGEQSGFKLKFEQRYFVVENTAFVLTLTCMNDNFDDYKGIARKIFDTFKIK